MSVLGLSIAEREHLDAQTSIEEIDEALSRIRDRCRRARERARELCRKADRLQPNGGWGDDGASGNRASLLREEARRLREEARDTRGDRLALEGRRMGLRIEARDGSEAEREGAATAQQDQRDRLAARQQVLWAES